VCSSSKAKQLAPQHSIHRDGAHPAVQSAQVFDDGSKWPAPVLVDGLVTLLSVKHMG
jgi:hypothetical protein